MSELKLVVAVDTSQAEGALAGIPDAAERANRRILAGVAGRGQRDYQGSRTQYTGMAGMQGEIEKDIQKQAEAEKKAAAEVEKQNREKYEAELKWNSKLQQDKDKFLAEQEQAGLDKYEAELKWNSKLQEDADKAAAAEEKAAIERYQASLRWNSKLQEDQDKAEAERLKSEREARDKEAAETEAWHRKELARKLKEIGEQRKAEDKAAKQKQKELDRQASDAEGWGSKFMSSIFQGMGMGAGFGIARMLGGWIGGVLSIVSGSFKDSFNRGREGATSEAFYGTNANDMFQSYLLLKNLSGLSEEESNAMSERVASMAQDILAGGGEGKAALQYFGITDFEKIRKEGFSMMDLYAGMADRYKTSGGTRQYQDFAKELFGADWKKLRPVVGAGREVVEAGTAVTLEGGPRNIDPFSPGLRAANLRRAMVGLPPLSSLEGGREGGIGMPMITPVTSIQAMGGGDVLSAVNKGPMDAVAKATEETAANTRQLVAQDTGRMRMNPNGVISFVR